MAPLPTIALAILLAQAEAPGPRGTPQLEPPSDTRIRVFKTERRLELWLKGRLELETSIGLGWRTSGPKREKNDGRTPGGEYSVCGKNPVSRHYLSLSLSYPNAVDAAAGLREGSITREEHDAILAALEAGECPPWDTALGGRIFLHGDHEQGDWTMGCVAVDNHSMDRIYERVPVGTPIELHP